MKQQAIGYSQARAFSSTAEHTLYMGGDARSIRAAPTIAFEVRLGIPARFVVPPKSRAVTRYQVGLITHMGPLAWCSSESDSDRGGVETVDVLAPLEALERIRWWTQSGAACPGSTVTSI